MGGRAVLRQAGPRRPEVFTSESSLELEHHACVTRLMPKQNSAPSRNADALERSLRSRQAPTLTDSNAPGCDHYGPAAVDSFSADLGVRGMRRQRKAAELEREALSSAVRLEAIARQDLDKTEQLA